MTTERQSASTGGRECLHGCSNWFAVYESRWLYTSLNSHVGGYLDGNNREPPWELDRVKCVQSRARVERVSVWCVSARWPLSQSRGRRATRPEHASDLLHSFYVVS